MEGENFNFDQYSMNMDLQTILEDVNTGILTNPISTTPSPTLLNYVEQRPNEHFDHLLWNENNSAHSSSGSSPSISSTHCSNGGSQSISPNGISNDFNCDQQVQQQYEEQKFCIEQEKKHCITPPILTLSLTAWPGVYNFEAHVPEMDGTLKGKYWKRSETLDRIYLDKGTTVPICLKMNYYPPGVSVSLCLVYTDPTYRTLAVHRCPADKSIEEENPLKEHILRVEQHNKPFYYRDQKRCVIDVPLHAPPAGDLTVPIYCSMACLTSCVGGPNRKLFSILLTLKVNNVYIGRQAINVKCSAGSKRDMKNDEKSLVKKQLFEAKKRAEAEASKENQPKRANQEEVREIVRGLAVPCPLKSKSSNTKRVKIATSESMEDELEMVFVKLPRKYVKAVRKHVNNLYTLDVAKSRAIKDRIFSEESSS